MFGNVVYVNNYIVSKSMNITPFWSLLGTENDVINIFYSGEAVEHGDFYHCSAFKGCYDAAVIPKL